jgi:DNA polymerase
MPNLFWDIEARSTVNLETVGAWRYAATAATEVLCIAYAVNVKQPQIWIPGRPVPTEFVQAAADPRWRLIAHNVGFERALAVRLLGPRYGWPQIPISQWRCSMAVALANAYPGSLEGVAAAL